MRAGGRRQGWWLPLAVVIAVAGLALAGRLTAPPPARPPAAVAPADTRPSCDPAGATRRVVRATDGPELRPPVAGLRLEPAEPRPGDLGAARAGALARELVGDADAITARARFLLVSRGPLRRRPAWVVAVAGVPAGLGFCGPVGSREVVVALDPRSGRELLRYSYR